MWIIKFLSRSGISKGILGLIRDTLKCLRIGTPKTINFPFVPNGKLMMIGVPIFKHFRALGKSWEFQK